MDQTNKFKPANHDQAVENHLNEEKTSKELQSLVDSMTIGSEKRAGLQKSKSYGSNISQSKGRVLKNSNKDGVDVGYARKCVISPNNLMADDEMLLNNGTNSSASLTASTGEELVNKLKSDEKSKEKLTHLKNKDEQSGIESSDKSENEAKDLSKEKKPSNKEKEKLCQRWIKELSKLESDSNMEPSHVHTDDDIPKY